MNGLVFCGPIVAVFSSSKHNGVMDTARNVLVPGDSGEHIQPDAPEAGPFTRADLDDRARRFPRATQ
jgi:hypothetical protein